MESLNRKASKDAAMQQIRTVEEILRRWDPIGVEPGIFAPPDEYDRYAPHIVSMVQNGCTIGELAAHLDHLSAELWASARVQPRAGHTVLSSQRRSLAS
jgi:hypothetical protein